MTNAIAAVMATSVLTAATMSQKVTMRPWRCRLPDWRLPDRRFRRGVFLGPPELAGRQAAVEERPRPVPLDDPQGGLDVLHVDHDAAGARRRMGRQPPERAPVLETAQFDLGPLADLPLEGRLIRVEGREQRLRRGVRHARALAEGHRELKTDRVRSVPTGSTGAFGHTVLLSERAACGDTLTDVLRSRPEKAQVLGILLVENRDPRSHVSPHQFVGGMIQIADLERARPQSEMQEGVSDRAGTPHGVREVVAAGL